MHMIPGRGERGPRVAAQAPIIAGQMHETLAQYQIDSAAAGSLEERAVLANNTLNELTTKLGDLVADSTRQARENAELTRKKEKYNRHRILAGAVAGALAVNSIFGLVVGGQSHEASADNPTSSGNTPAMTSVFGNTLPTQLGPTPAQSQNVFPIKKTVTVTAKVSPTQSGNPNTASGAPSTQSGNPNTVGGVTVTVSGLPGTVGGAPTSGGAPTVGGAPTKEALSPAAKALKERQAMLSQADSKSTVAGAVATLRSTPATIAANIRNIFNRQSPKTLDHSEGSMSSLRSQYGHGELGPLNSAEAVAYSVKGSPAYAAKVYNEMHNIKGNQLPDGVSEQEALKSIEATMLEATDHFSTSKPTITVENNGQRGETVFAAGVMHLNHDTKVFTMITDDGMKIRFKIENRCLNILEEEEETPVMTSTPVVVHQKVIEIIKKIEKRKHNKKHPGKPQRPTTPTPPVHKPKHDSNTTPGGVPGQNHGTPDVAGQGPAGQDARPDGTVGNEHLPAALAPDATPKPLPNGSETAPPANGQVTGHDGGSGQTTTGSTVTGETPPTSDPNPQG